jgi:hypothetical protein
MTGAMPWPLLGVGLLTAVTAGLLGAFAWLARQVVALRRRLELEAQRHTAEIDEIAHRLAELDRLSEAQGWSEGATRNARVLEALRRLLVWTENLRARPAGEPAADPGANGGS